MCVHMHVCVLERETEAQRERQRTQFCELASSVDAGKASLSVRPQDTGSGQGLEKLLKSPLFYMSFSLREHSLCSHKVYGLARAHPQHGTLLP